MNREDLDYINFVHQSSSLLYSYSKGSNNMAKNDNRDASYEDIVKGKPEIYEQSEVAAYNPPAQNDYEKAKWNSNGYDQMGVK